MIGADRKLASVASVASVAVGAVDATMAWVAKPRTISLALPGFR